MARDCSGTELTGRYSFGSKWGNTAVQLRYRYEYVDQDKTAHPANASTLKSRLTWNSGVVNGYKGLVEVDNVSVIGAERYNSTVNGLTSILPWQIQKPQSSIKPR